MKKTMKKYFAIFLVLAMITTLVPIQVVSAVEPIIITVTPSKTTASVGDEIIYTVTMSSAEGTNFSSFQFDIDIPAGMSYMTGSGTIDESFAENLGWGSYYNFGGTQIFIPTENIIFGENPDRVTGYYDTFYNGTEDIAICTFVCTAEETGSYSVSLKSVSFYGDGGTTALATSVVSTEVAVNHTLKDINVTLSAPVTGAVPETVVSGDGYEGIVSWESNPDVFSPGTVYAATITLTAEDLYEFDESATVTVNGETSGVITSINASQLVFTVEFPETGKSPLTVKGATAVDRDYDKTTDVTINGGNLEGVIGNDSVTITSITGTVSDADAGTDKPVTVTVTLGGDDSEKYTIVTLTDLKVTINKATPVYSVPKTQNVRLGAVLSVFTESAPNSGTGVGGEAVSGTVSWYSENGYSNIAADTDIEGLEINDVKTLYWRFKPASANYAVQQGSTEFTVVAGDPQPMTFESGNSITETYGSASFINAAVHTGGGSGKGAITYSIDDESVAAVNAETGEVTIVGVGTAIIKATAASVDGAWAKSEITYTLTVNKANPSAGDFECVLPSDLIYNGQAKDVTVASKTGLSGLGTINTIKYNGSETAPVNAGSYTLTVEVDAGTNYNAGVVSLGELTIIAKPLTDEMFTIDGIYIYSGTAQTPDYTVADGELLTDTDYISIVPTQTDAGSYPISITGKNNYSGTVTKNFVIEKLTPQSENLEINIPEPSDYDGLPRTASVAAGSGKNGLGTVTILYNGSANLPVNAGIYAVTVNIEEGTNYSSAEIALGSLTIQLADYTYAALPEQNVKQGGGLSAITAFPTEGTTADSVSVPGTILWFNNEERTIAAEDSDLSALPVGDDITLYWRFTPENENYKVKDGSAVFTIVSGDPQPLEFDSAIVNKTYGDENFIHAVRGAEGIVTYTSDNTDIAVVNAATGEVTIVGAGETVIKATATAVLGEWAETSKAYSLIIAKKTPVLSDLVYTIPTGHKYTGLGQGIGTVTSDAEGFGAITVKYDNTSEAPVDAKTYAVAADITAGNNYTAAVLTLDDYIIQKAPITPNGAVVAPKTYDGTVTAEITEIIFTGLQNDEILVLDTDYTVSDAVFNAAGVADANNVSGTVTLVNSGTASNYELTNEGFTQEATIEKATLTNVPNGQVYINTGVPRTFELTKLLVMPEGWAYKVNGEPATSITVSDDDAGNFEVVLTNVNYNDAVAIIEITITDKQIITEIEPTLTLDKTYDGTEVTYEGEWTPVFYPENPVNAGDYTLTLTREDDDEYIYEPVTISFTISKAELTITADDKEINKYSTLPDYTFTAQPATLYGSDTWITEPLVSAPTADPGTEGTYVIRVTEGVLSAPDNYNVIYVNGTLTVNESNDAALASLSIGSGITLTPAFDPAITSYTANVGHSISNVTVTATPNDTGASVSGTGTHSLNSGENVITVEVTAEDGTTVSVYTITVVRAVNIIQPGVNVPKDDKKDETPELSVDINGSAFKITRNADGSYSILLTETDVTNNLKGGNDLTITAEDTEHIQLTIPLSAFDTGVGLRVDSAFGNIYFPSETLQALSAKHSGNLTISIRKGSFVVELKSGNSVIEYNDPANPFVITLPYTLKSGQDSNAVVAVRKDGSDIVEPYAVYNNGALTFKISSTGVYDVVYNAVSFNDVDGHWAASYIAFVSARGLYNGTGGGMFSPDTQMTRAMFAQVLANLEGISPSYANSRFSDVPADAWYAAAVDWAAGIGIVSGVGNGEFDPDSNITREQMAVILNNYIKYKEITLPVSQTMVAFIDEDKVSSWATESVKTIQAAGIINGKPGNLFDPKDSATRAEVGAIFARFIEAAAK